jgi:hypothetical protein
VGGFAMAQSETQTARLRCVAHLPLSARDVRGTESTPPHDPRDASTYRTLDDAQITPDSSGVLVLPITTESNTAPGVR